MKVTGFAVTPAVYIRSHFVVRTWVENCIENSPSLWRVISLRTWSATISHTKDKVTKESIAKFNLFALRGARKKHLQFNYSAKVAVGFSVTGWRHSRREVFPFYILVSRTTQFPPSLSHFSLCSPHFFISSFAQLGITRLISKWVIASTQAALQEKAESREDSVSHQGRLIKIISTCTIRPLRFVRSEKVRNGTRGWWMLGSIAYVCVLVLHNRSRALTCLFI